MKKIIEIRDLKFKYNSGAEALKGVSLDVFEGEWLSIIGHNGSGKSTLSKLIAGLLPLEHGTIKVDGIELNYDSVYDVRSKLGIVFQNPDNQFVGSTVEDDIAFGLENIGVKREEMIDRITQFSNKVRMNEFLKREPHLLSGGQKQRVAIAGVLAMHPKIIILDEATSMLDPIGRKEIIETIHDLYENDHITIISITHDLEEAANSDRMIVLNDGLIEMMGTPREVFKNTKRLEEIGLDIPFSIKVADELKKRDIQIDDILTESELVEKIWQLYSTK
jgi:energy-coupling factor transport system ATP-binding protein